MKARFVTSAANVFQLPDLDLPEAAFVGRSNVGKSSLLGKILNAPKLVRTSRTPGRTQLLNLFLFEERIALVDLPGYGYAKLSKGSRARLQVMIREYLLRRESLTGVVQILDARREKVTEDDRSVAEMVLQNDRPLLIALTKIDLIPKNRRKLFTQRIEQDLGIPAGSAVPCSAKTGEGRGELVSRLNELAGS